MRNVIVKHANRPQPEHVARLAELGVATVHESMGRRGLLDAAVNPVYPGARIAGRAVTVLSQPGDNLMIHAAVELCEPGDILAVATTSPSTDGMFGELLATSLQARGVIGIVIDAGVRDVSELKGIDFPAWSRAVSAQGTVKATAGSVNVPIVVAGALINPGDVLVADDDGVVVVPLAQVGQTVEAASARESDEQGKRERLAAGELSLDIYHLRELLAELGVEYVSSDQVA